MNRQRSKMEKYAEKYFNDNGFRFESKEEELYTEYILQKDGISMKWCAIKNERRYKHAMDGFEQDWNIMCQCHRINAVKEEIDKKYGKSVSE